MSEEKNLKRIFHIFRHGETDWNRDERMQGGTDISLNEVGRQQASKLAEYFRVNPVEVFFSSDLSRAHETAKIAAGKSGVPIILEPLLRETNLGDAEGLTHEEFVNRFGSEQIEMWRQYPDHPNVRFQNGETKIQHLTRMKAALSGVIKNYSYRHIGVATHGGSIRRLIHHWRENLPAPVMVPNCAVFRAVFDEANGLWAVDLG